MQLARRSDQRGIALVLSLMALIVVGGIGLLLYSRTLNEMTHSRDDARIVQTLMLARGGANIGSVLLGTTVADDLHEIVELTSKPGRWAYGLDQNPMTNAGPDSETVASALETVASQLQSKVDSQVCNKPITVDGTTKVTIRVHFTATACGQALPSSVTLPRGRYVEGIPRGGSLDGIQTYAVPVVMVSEALLGDFRRNIVVQGEYLFDVGQTSFAHYAYFTNRESDSGGRIWFTDETIIDGPTHTNSNFSFYSTPWFGGRVTSAGCQNKACTGTRTTGAYFYNNTSKIIGPDKMTPNASAPNISGHAPRFAAGVQWNGAVIPLPTSAYSQELVAKGIDRLDQGLYFSNNLYSLDLWAGDGNGNTLTKSGGNWNVASWQYVRACTGKRDRVKSGSSYVYQFNGTCEVWRFNASGTIQKLKAGGQMSKSSDWITQPRDFNGVIFVDGKIDRLTGPERTNASNADTAPPAIAEFAQVTVAAEGDIRLTTDLKYEQPPCTTRPTKDNKGNVTRAQCNNRNHPNVLGVYSQGGDIIVGSDNYVDYGKGNVWDPDLNAPTDVNVHAVLMSGTDQIRVEGYVKTNGNGSFDKDMGNFYLLGGMIQENRGIFGTFGSNTRRGYDRVYTYDPRMMEGVAPPFFPTTGLGDVKFAAFFSFGQREQVY